MVTGTLVKPEDTKIEVEVEDFVISIMDVLIIMDGLELIQMVVLHCVIETHV